LVNARAATEFYEGYITNFAEVTPGEDWRTWDYRSSSTYDETGLRPSGLNSGTDIEIYMQETEFSGRILNQSGRFMDEGIGAIIRGVIGDRLVVTFESWE